MSDLSYLPVGRDGENIIIRRGLTAEAKAPTAHPLYRRHAEMAEILARALVEGRLGGLTDISDVLTGAFNQCAELGAELAMSCDADFAEAGHMRSTT